jgi:sulfide:quinone oxidoreductase
VTDDGTAAAVKVVIAGGGIAGLEALLALHDLAGERAEITLVAPQPDFVYKPMAVDEPFSEQPAERHELEPLATGLGATFVQRGVARVDPGGHVMHLDDGSTLSYDYGLICAGAPHRVALEHAITFKAAGEELRLSELLTEAKEGRPDRIAFVVPPGNTWPLPLYELALLTQWRAHRLGLEGLEIVIVTPESGPLIVFGTVASNAVAELLKVRGIEVRAGTRAHEDAGGAVVLTPGDERLEADHVVALPVLDPPPIEGLPVDAAGFIPIDQHARVKGADDLYAAGDGTNFPIKQGGLGTQQADAAAEHLAARLGAPVEPHPFHPILRGKLLVGDESLNLRHSLEGGQGEGSVSPGYLWWPPHKVSGRYLAAFLAHELPREDAEPPQRPIEVEVALPVEWHEEPMALDPHDTPRID